MIRDKEYLFHGKLKGTSNSLLGENFWEIEYFNELNSIYEFVIN